MSFSEIPPPPEVEPGHDPPVLRCRPPGPQSRTWLTRWARHSAPMGAHRTPSVRQRVTADVPSGTVVYATAKGSNVIDVDGNRYVDLAAGFGAVLIGHAHPNVLRVIELQSQRLLMALGDVHPADAKIGLLERLAKLHPSGSGQVILGQSGADAITAALKTAALVTGRPGIVAFSGGYHGLSYAPLAACGLREGYRAPFAEQLNAHVRFFDYPGDEPSLDRVVEEVRAELSLGRCGAVLVEPILGRGGCVVPPPGFLSELAHLARRHGALLVADEIWTGLGRAGALLFSGRDDVCPDLVCLGKGLGGGLPISACIGSPDVMSAWQRDPEVVDTSTFAGAPLACATALATLDVIQRRSLVERSAQLGARLLADARRALSGVDAVEAVRGSGLMMGVDLGDRPGIASQLQLRLLERGYVVSTGGGKREVLVITPALTVGEAQLEAFIGPLSEAVRSLRL